MAETKQDMLNKNFSRIFIGVRFVLAGFDFLKKEQIRSKLLEGGGVDVSEYGPDCTQLIVDGTISIMYRLPRDLDGIPGAKSLILCLSGYQRKDRDNIMLELREFQCSFCGVIYVGYWYVPDMGGSQQSERSS
ncbi:hypothetical protein HAX54_040886 [Datura stramonium]|uniref:Uncharacterized protein n=1 Tax=Datura stramonium TaxID=4076 RepID=A0ABS8SLT5_DATST|nr:hypothetical protein [Datura stramonium]